MPTSANVKTSDCQIATRSIEPSIKKTTEVVATRLAFKKLIGSTTIILIVLLGLTAFAINRIPGKYLDAADGVPSTFRVVIGKISKYLSSKEDSDIVLLGSSLLLFPSARCDDQMRGKPLCYDDWYMDQFVLSYDKSMYFESLLKEAGINSSIKNLAISSSLMSDHFALFKAVIEGHKHPKMIICGLAPRDFIDPSISQSITPTQQLLSEYRANQNDNLAIDFSSEGIDLAKTNFTHHFEKSVARIRAISSDLFSDAANRSEIIEKVRLNTSARPNTFRDTPRYRRIYGQKNKEMLVKQAEYLSNLISCANEHGVKVVILNMPLTKENTNLLDHELYYSYLDTIRKAAQNKDVLFLDLGSESKYDSKTDFEDSSHLSAQGGQKLFKTVVTAISQEPSLVRSLSRKPQ